jgi:hypothetical protein
MYMFIQCIYMCIHCTWVPHIKSIYPYGIYHCCLVCTALVIGMYYATVQELVTPAQAQLAPAAAGRLLQLLHLPPALSGRLGHGVLRGRLLRLMLIKLVCLNLNRCDTWQQPDPAYRPASRANKKAAPKGIHQCTYNIQQCLYIL